MTLSKLKRMKVVHMCGRKGEGGWREGRYVGECGSMSKSTTDPLSKHFGVKVIQ